MLTKASSKPTISGDKGKEFQAKVAELYRLLGAETIENVELCGKKVDLLAVFKLPGGVGEHRAIVECKAESTNRAQNQRVMEFCGLLETARRAGQADSAEIVTLRPWSEQAKGFARQAGVGVLTYDEKLSRLIDFGPYLRELVASVNLTAAGEVSPLAERYVTIRGQRGENLPIPDVLAYLADWASDENVHSPLVILGEYGSGKTSLCRMLAAILAERFLDQPGQHRMPILLSLGEFTKRTRLESLISSFLDDTCGVSNPRFRLFEAMNKAGFFLAILDGFDEMAARTDADTVDANLVEIEKLARDAWTKLVLTSRPEYFISRLEQQQAFSPDATTPLARQVRYEELSISLWSQEDIESFLRRRVPSKSKHSWEFFRDQIAGIPGLTDLSRRPVLAEMITQTLPALVEDGQAITRVKLYEKYIQGELRRQRVHNRRHLLLPDDTRIALLQELAADSYTDAAVPITFARAQEQIRSLSGVPAEDIRPVARDFLACSFLIRRNDEFRLSHKSLQEYLTARALVAEIRNAQFKAFGRMRLDEAVLGFMQELDSEAPLPQDTLIECVRRSRYTHDARVPVLPGNAATVLVRIAPCALAHVDLTRVAIKGADMRFANLMQTTLEEAVFEDVDLRCAALPPRGLDATMRFSGRVSIALIARPAIEIQELRRLAEQVSESVGNRVHSSEFSREHEKLYGYCDMTVVSRAALGKAVDLFRDDPHITEVWVHEYGDARASARWPEVCEKIRSLITRHVH